jgi:hypothetical protein
MACRDRSYAIPCCYIAELGRFSIWERNYKPPLCFTKHHTPALLSSYSVWCGAVPRGSGTVLLKRRVMSFDITQVAHGFVAMNSRPNVYLLNSRGLAPRRCPNCYARMKLTQIEPSHRCGYDLRIFECEDCHYLEKLLVQSKSLIGVVPKFVESQ